MTSLNDRIAEFIVDRLPNEGSAVELLCVDHNARKIICALVEAGFQVFVVNPRRIKAFRDAEGLIAKTFAQSPTPIS